MWDLKHRTGIGPAAFFDLHSFCSAGVPHFIQEPQDVSVFPNVPFNLTCAAVGPPGPVEVLWWLSGAQVGQPRPSPSVLFVPGQKALRCPSASWEICHNLLSVLILCNNVLETHAYSLCVSPCLSPCPPPPGVNDTLKFYCEAKNTRGISVSRTGTVHIKGAFAVTITSVAMVACKPSYFSVEILMLVWHDAIVSCLAWQKCSLLRTPTNKIIVIVIIPLNH